MSFGDGNLHEENRRLRAYIASLEDKVDHLKDVNGDLAREINRQERRIRELEAARIDRVYIVETMDDLMDSWHVDPVCYADKQKAMERAERMTYEDPDMVRHGGKWTEIEVRR